MNFALLSLSRSVGNAYQHFVEVGEVNVGSGLSVFLAGALITGQVSPRTTGAVALAAAGQTSHRFLQIVKQSGRSANVFPASTKETQFEIPAPLSVVRRT